MLALNARKQAVTTTNILCSVLKSQPKEAQFNETVMQGRKVPHRAEVILFAFQNFCFNLAIASRETQRTKGNLANADMNAVIAA